MGTSFEVAGVRYPVIDFSVSETSTPLAVNDSSGGVGSATVTVSPDEGVTYGGDEPRVKPAARFAAPEAIGYIEGWESRFVRDDTPESQNVSLSQVDIPDARGFRKAIRVEIPPGGTIHIFPHSGGSFPTTDSVPPFDPPAGLPRLVVSLGLVPVSVPPNLSVASVTPSVESFPPAYPRLLGQGKVQPGDEGKVKTWVWGNNWSAEFINPRSSVRLRNPPTSSEYLVLDVFSSGTSFWSPDSGAPFFFSGFDDPLANGLTPRWQDGVPRSGSVLDQRSYTDPGAGRVSTPNSLVGARFTLKDDWLGSTHGSIESVTDSESGVTFECSLATGSWAAHQIELGPFQGTVDEFVRMIRDRLDPTLSLRFETGSNPSVVDLDRGSYEPWWILKRVLASRQLEAVFSGGSLHVVPTRGRGLSLQRTLSRSTQSSDVSSTPRVDLYYRTRRTYSLNNGFSDFRIYPSLTSSASVLDDPILTASLSNPGEAWITLPTEVSFLTKGPHRDTSMSIYDDEDTYVGSIGYIEGNIYYPPTRGWSDRITYAQTFERAVGSGVRFSPYQHNFSLSIDAVPNSDNQVLVRFSVSGDVPDRTYRLVKIIDGVESSSLKLWSRREMAYHPVEVLSAGTGETIQSATSGEPEALDMTETSLSEEDAGRAVLGAAHYASGYRLSYRGSIVPDPVDPSGGEATYGDVETLLDSSSATYDTVVSSQEENLQGDTYAALMNWFSVPEGGVALQGFGSFAGSVFFDESSRHHFRVREATATPAGVEIVADSYTQIDHVDEAIERWNPSATYGDVQSAYDSYLGAGTYKQVALAGVPAWYDIPSA